ncbi:MAG: polysaccharide pyruvyl transferase family protein [Clostridia bacterium]|nr:polysaccharide pyruvyl transferase family protein [Clostridia bacterium]
MKVGLITYHSAYNFGSVLQAYATQEVIREIAGNCEIINYRTQEQRRVYAIFTWAKGANFFKSLAKNALILPSWNQRRKRAQKYEACINKLFSLSKECKSPAEVYDMWNQYDAIVSGSDQIWNKHSKELHFASWENMNPYLLHGYFGKKVSYASSTANMTDEELKRIIPDIDQFDFVSVREKATADRLRAMCAVDIANVLDPTFLLTKREWMEQFNLSENQFEDYVLYYALNSRRELKKTQAFLREYAQKEGIKVKMIAPLGAMHSSKEVEVLNDVDPIAFLNYILNARRVITDSYHGTILSVNFNKDVYSICGQNVSDFRKTDILTRIGMQDRIISNVEHFNRIQHECIDYKQVNSKLNQYRKSSYEYLKNALL